MRLFIKAGSRDKLINLVKEGGGFQTVEVMVTSDFELTVPEPERKDWIELYPSWDYRTIKVDPLQCGAMFAMIMTAAPMSQRIMHSVQKQLIAIKKQVEEDAGVTKEVLPGGIIKSTDKDGTVIIREPFPHEISNN